MNMVENLPELKEKGLSLWPFICLALTVALMYQSNSTSKSLRYITILEDSLTFTQKQLDSTRSALNIADSLLENSYAYAKRQRSLFMSKSKELEELKEGKLLEAQGKVDTLSFPHAVDTVVVVNPEIVNSYQEALMATARLTAAAIEDNKVRDSVIEEANKTLDRQLDAQIAELKREHSRDKRDNILIGIGGAIIGFIAKSVASKGKEE